MEFLPYSKQSIDEQDIKAVSDALKSEWITRGPLVEAFEQEIAAYCNAKYAVAFPNGSIALLAACHAAKVQTGDEVITTSNTFFATAGAPMQCGAKIKFIDIDRNTGNFDLAHLENTPYPPLSRGKRIIIPVHFAGRSVDMQRLDRSIKDPSTIVIEDGAHALGSLDPEGNRVGACTYSQMTMFSFHPAKNITTCEGGMITTNDPLLLERLKIFRNNGIVKHSSPLPWEYEVSSLSSNYNFTEMQAALGRSQLKKLDQFVEKRRALVRHYRKLLAPYPWIRLFDDSMDHQTAFHLFVVQIEQMDRTRVMNQLKEKKIGSQVHYIPLYHHPIFKEKVPLEETENYYRSALSLPLFPEMSKKEVEYIVDSLVRIGQDEGLCHT